MSNRLGFADVVTAACHQAFAVHDTLVLARAASGTPYPAADMPYCIQALLDLIAQGLVAVAVVGDRVVGTIVLDYARWPWCAPQNPKGVHIYNQQYWVEPEYRKGGVAAKLLAFAKDVADRKQLPLVITFSSIDMKPELRDRFARINGLCYTGGVFFREPKV